MAAQRGWAIVSLAFLVLGCPRAFADKPPTIYEPVSGPAVETFYARGIPFAFATSDSVSLMVSLEPAELAGRHRIRMWLMYVNKASKPVLLEPMTMASLETARAGKHETATAAPMPASQVLKAISSERASSLIAQVIGGALRSAGAALSASPTTISGPGGTWTVNDASAQAARQGQIQRETAAGMQATTNSYDLFSASVNAGILRKTTVFPQTSVNGYVYFTLKDWNADFRKLEHTLTVTLPWGTQAITFHPKEGE